MAKKNENGSGQTKRSSGDGRASFVGYVNVTLTEEDRGNFDAWYSDADVWFSAYLDALEAGYQFTTKFDAEGDCFMCTISNWHVSAEDSGVLYTGRASDVAVALAKAVFVWDQRLQRNLNNGNVKNARRDAF